MPPLTEQPSMEQSLAPLRPLERSTVTSEEERPPPPPSSSSLARLPALPSEARRLRILCFDCENRPSAYWYEGRPTAEITAIAASWFGEEKVHCWLLGIHNKVEMLQQFCKDYDRADIVVGHYIRKHDLPMINGELMRHKLRPLREKLAWDTHGELVKTKDKSKSLETLAEEYGLENKHHMSIPDWEQANKLLPEGIKEARQRAESDVRITKALHPMLVETGALKPQPRLWKP